MRHLCLAAGHEPLIPLDSDATTAEAIYLSNISMWEAADGVIANLDHFRGAEPDSGTCFEIGFALAKGKRVIGVLSSSECLKTRVARWQNGPVENVGGKPVDRDGFCVEDFGASVNLMLAVPVTLVVGNIEAAIAAFSGGSRGERKQ